MVGHLNGKCANYGEAAGPRSALMRRIVPVLRRTVRRLKRYRVAVSVIAGTIWKKTVSVYATVSI
jgi:hypothetical protein